MAGLLGEIFSAGNVAKRKLTDLLGNPLLSAQQFVGNLNDRARVLNEMTAAAAKEGVNYGPASKQLAGLLADAYNPMGITVYHGSPAKFSKFDPTKIGSGEGAQAYGYGHYVAEAPGVAQSYKRTQIGNAQELEQMALRSGVSPDAANTIAQWYHTTKNANKFDDFLKLMDTPHPSEVINNFRKSVIAQKPELKKAWEKFTAPGNLYEIDLPDEQIAKMLDWDKPLKDQPEVLKAIRNQIQDADIEKSFDANVKSGISGANAMQNYVWGKNPAERSEAMRQAGIPGIRYLDQGSRGTGEGTSNFVVFPGNEGLLTIQKRNNEVIAPTGLLETAPKAVEPAQSLLDRATIRSSADNLAQKLNDLGFKADVVHSGSKAGPSSYVQIYDPQTGRFFTKQVRFSGHGKGPKEAQGVIDIQDVEKDTKNIIDAALEMRSAGKSKVVLMQEKADELIAEGMNPKRAYAEAKKLFE